MGEITIILIEFGKLYLTLFVFMSISLFITTSLSKKFTLVKIKKLSYKQPVFICFQIFGIHFISTMIFMTIGLSDFNKYLQIAAVILHVIVSISLMFYFMWLIKKVYKVRWRASLAIYVFSGLITTGLIFLFFGGYDFIISLPY